MKSKKKFEKKFEKKLKLQQKMGFSTISGCVKEMWLIKHHSIQLYDLGSSQPLIERIPELTNFAFENYM